MQCHFMQRTKSVNGEYKFYPCGHCAACRKNDTVEWGLRSYFEAQSYEQSVFVTLTYDDEHLLQSKMPGYSGLLSPTHIKDFCKSFSYYNRAPFRYFIGGEYGENTNRAHYHAVLFGVRINSPAFTDRFWVDSKQGYNSYCKAWPYGFILLQPLTPQRCFYAAKYATKYSKDMIDEMKLFGQQPPFRRMSKGLGLNWFLQHKDEVVLRGYITFKGCKIRIPRYYFDKAFPHDSPEREAWVYNRRAFFKDFADKKLDVYKNFVGKGKQYGSWYYLHNALGEQYEINSKKGKI